MTYFLYESSYNNSPHQISQAEAPKSSNPKIKFSAKNLESFEGLLNTIILYESLTKAIFFGGGVGFLFGQMTELKSAGRFTGYGNLGNLSEGIVMKKPTAMSHTFTSFCFLGLLVLIDSLSTDHHRGFLFVRRGIQQVIMTKQRSPPDPRFPPQGSLEGKDPTIPSYLPPPSPSNSGLLRSRCCKTCSRLCDAAGGEIS